MSSMIETARSGRSTCRHCSKPIVAGELRLGAQDAKRSRPGKPSYRWYHLMCATIAMPNSLGAALGEFEGEVENRAALEAELNKERPPIPIGAEAYDEKGEVGEVVWFGKSRYDESMRVGLKLASGQTLWLPAAEVTLLGSSPDYESSP